MKRVTGQKGHWGKQRCKQLETSFHLNSDINPHEVKLWHYQQSNQWLPEQHLGLVLLMQLTDEGESITVLLITCKTFSVLSRKGVFVLWRTLV